MPFMHSEHLADQVALRRAVPKHLPDNLKYAEEHADIIRRFGRFPHRNRIAGTRQQRPKNRLFWMPAGFPADDITVKRPLLFSPA